MRVVLDTNTVISGLLWRGPPRQILDLARQGKITLYTSLALLSELDSVLKRPKFASRLVAANLAPSTLVTGYSALACVIHSPPPIPRVCRDPSDDDVLACAQAAKAGLLVSGDLDLLAVQRYNGISIANSTQALARILASPP